MSAASRCWIPPMWWDRFCRMSATEVLEELDGWVKIPSGYISTDYVEVKYALNEARELDLITMALSQYDNLVISKVNNYLNVREEPPWMAKSSER